MTATASPHLVPFQAERIFAQANDADQAETHASVECVDVKQTGLGLVYAFADRSTLTVKGMAMRWDPARADTALNDNQKDTNQ